MNAVAVVGVGMHRFGRFPDRSVTELCRTAVAAALADAGLVWNDIQAVSAASSRFAGGKGWGLNGNDIVDDFGPNGVPVYNLSAGCAAGGNAFNVGYSLVAGGLHDTVLVVGGEKMPKGMIQYAGLDDRADLEYVRQRCVGVSGPACWALETRRRMADYGTTDDQLAKVAVKSHQLAAANANARFREPFSLDQVLDSPLVSDPLRLYEICPVSDGAAAVVICSAERARQLTTLPVWVAGSAVATAQFGDGLPVSVATIIPQGATYHSEVALAVGNALGQAGVEATDLDLVEISDNAVHYEFVFPELFGMCEAGEAERLLEKGETLPLGRMPINASGGFLSFGEATTAMGVFQVCELTWQLRGQAGSRQVPGAAIGLGQTLGLGNNGSAIVLKR